MDRVISKPHSFHEFIDDEDKLKVILDRAGVKYGNSHRIAASFSKLREKSKDIKSKGVTQFNGNDTMLLIDLCEMHTIIDRLDEIPKEIIKLKWERLINGSLNRWEDSQSNSVGRNTQFELVLYSDLRQSNVACEVKEPNPDIQIMYKNTGLNIQCKRILGNKQNAVQRNIQDAVRQLRADHKVNGFQGAVALCIERVFSGGNSFVSSPNQYAALDFIKETHNTFINNYRRFWSSKKVLGTDNIPMIILYTSQIAMLSSDSLKFSHVTERDYVETITSQKIRKNYNKFREVMNIPTRN